MTANVSKTIAADLARGARRVFLGPSAGGDPLDRHLVQGRYFAYRLVLPIIVLALALPALRDYLLGDYPWAVLAGAVLPLMLFDMYRQFRHQAPLLPPAAALLIVLSLMVLLVIRGETAGLYLLFPLLVAAPMVSAPRPAAWLGALTLSAAIPLAGMRLEAGAAGLLCAGMTGAWLVSAWAMSAVSRQWRELGALAITDPLTELFNRRHLLNEAGEALQAWRRYRRPTTLLLLDVDAFKSINDELGHEAGDQALRVLARVLRGRLRALDTVCRYGGEEFAVLLVETVADQAALVAEALRAQVASAEIVPGRTMTVSIGLCDVARAESVEHWIEQCDRSLYRAKASGRNRVVQAAPAGETE